MATQVQPLTKPPRARQAAWSANVCAQTEALAFGKRPSQVGAESTLNWLVAQWAFEGNRPLNMILAEKLTPENSSTPHWSKESIFQIAPWVNTNTECPYRAT